MARMETSLPLGTEVEAKRASLIGRAQSHGCGGRDVMTDSQEGSPDLWWELSPEPSGP
jgi:hypothetical protein